HRGRRRPRSGSRRHRRAPRSCCRSCRGSARGGRGGRRRRWGWYRPWGCRWGLAYGLLGLFYFLVVPTSSTPADIVLREGQVGRLELNRPGAINALTLEMVEILDGALAAWELDPEVVCVLLSGAGERGFCAGGDIVMMRDSVLAGEPERARAFWRGEYLLDA